MQILITSQRLENAAYYEAGVSWKFKGPVYFTLDVDIDDLMYDEDDVLKAINIALAKKSNDVSRYEYHSYQVIGETESLDAEFTAAYSILTAEARAQKLNSCEIKPDDAILGYYKAEGMPGTPTFDCPIFGLQKNGDETMVLVKVMTTYVWVPTLNESVFTGDIAIGKARKLHKTLRVA